MTIKTVNFSLTWASGNAAAVDDPAGEAIRILRETADRIETAGTDYARDVYDANGNRIGSVVLIAE